MTTSTIASHKKQHQMQKMAGTTIASQKIPKSNDDRNSNSVAQITTPKLKQQPKQQESSIKYSFIPWYIFHAVH